MKDDKPYVVFAVIILAVLACFRPEAKSLLEFYKVLASGLFGLVTGSAVTAAYMLRAQQKKDEGAKK